MSERPNLFYRMFVPNKNPVVTSLNDKIIDRLFFELNELERERSTITKRMAEIAEKQTSLVRKIQKQRDLKLSQKETGK